MYGRTQSAETIARISLKQKGIPKPKFICQTVVKSLAENQII